MTDLAPWVGPHPFTFAGGAAAKVEARLADGITWVDVSCKVVRVSWLAGTRDEVVATPTPGEAVVELVELNEPGDPYPLDPFPEPGDPMTWELWQPVRIWFGHNTPTRAWWYGWLNAWTTDPVDPARITWRCVDAFTRIADQHLSAVAAAGEGETDTARISNVMATQGATPLASGWPLPSDGKVLHNETPGATFLVAVQRAAIAGDRVVHVDAQGHYVLSRAFLTRGQLGTFLGRPVGHWIVGCHGASSGGALSAVNPIAAAEIAWDDDYLVTQAVTARGVPVYTWAVSVATAPSFVYPAGLAAVFNTPPSLFLNAGDVITVRVQLSGGVQPAGAAVNLVVVDTATSQRLQTFAVAAGNVPIDFTTPAYVAPTTGTRTVQLYLEGTSTKQLAAGTVGESVVRQAATSVAVVSGGGDDGLHGNHQYQALDLLLQRQADLAAFGAEKISVDYYSWRRVGVITLRPDLHADAWPLVGAIRVGDRVSVVLDERARWASRPWDTDGWVRALDVDLTRDRVQVQVGMGRMTRPPLFNVTGRGAGGVLTMQWSTAPPINARSANVQYLTAAGADAGGGFITAGVPSGAYTTPVAPPANAYSVQAWWRDPAGVASSPTSWAVTLP